MTLLEDEEWDAIKEDLPTNKIYNKLNGNANNTEYDKYCKELTEHEKDYSGISTFCKNFAKNIKNLSNILDTENNRDRCSYLTYWVYNEMRKIFKNKESKIYDLKIDEKIYKIRNTIFTETYNYFCPFYFEKDTLDEWKTEKDLYDYFKNYDALKKFIPSNKNKCEIFNTYLNYVSPLYEEHKNDCFHYGQCSYFFNIDYDPQKLLTKFMNCKDLEEHADLDKKDIPEPVENEGDHELSESAVDMNFYKLVCTKKPGEKDTQRTDDGTDMQCRYLMPSSSQSLEQLDTSTTHRGQFSEYITATDAIMKIGHANCENIYRDNQKIGFFCKNKTLDQTSDKVKENKVTGKEIDISNPSIKSGTDLPKENLEGEIKNPGNEDNSVKTMSENEMTDSIGESIYETGSSSEDLQKALQRSTFIFNNSRRFQGTQDIRPPSSGISTEIPVILEEKNTQDNPHFLRIGAGGALALGIVVVFFIYYKFTPFGSWMRRKGIKENNVIDNYLEEDIQHYSNSATEYLDTSSHNRRFHVAYNSM
ncbi:PIR Superfamily Protein [Plasmodium ovale wallikeri]|uniref:PIR Superfamily Protein n=1 Tax=Plasmodium ovale wallikeri TaxID=864142 RepID=A0A1A8YYS8_PLAOA|nr:PIR Superfamily Protein [Plasmodium ovale wallikeri]SBT37214.1 PIR Superfamily Protein [Plasmodium ovale wallikeri]